MENETCAAIKPEVFIAGSILLILQHQGDGQIKSTSTSTLFYLLRMVKADQTDLTPEHIEVRTQHSVHFSLCSPSQFQVESRWNCYKSMSYVKILSWFDNKLHLKLANWTGCCHHGTLNVSLYVLRVSLRNWSVDLSTSSCFTRLVNTLFFPTLPYYDKEDQSPA